MDKKINKLLLIMLIGIFFLSTFIYGKQFDKEGIYAVENPKTGAMIICKGDGSIIMKSMNNHTKTDIVKDDVTDEPTYIYKRISGEKVSTKEVYDGNRQLVYKYQYPSERLELYDIEGNFLDFNEQDVFEIESAVGDNILCYKGVDGEDDKEAYFFDVKAKQIKKAEYPRVFSIKEKQLYVMSYNPYTNNQTNATTFCDYSFNEIKKIENYNYEDYKTLPNGEVVIILTKTDGDRIIHNALDNDFNFIFEEDIPMGIWLDDEGKCDIKNDEMHIKYDFVNRKYDLNEKIEKSEKQKEIEKIAKEKEYGYLINGYYKVENNEINFYDEELNLIKKIDGKCNYVSNYRYDDKMIYLVYKEGKFDEENNYIEDIDIYDKDFNLLKEHCSELIVYEEDGILLTNNVIYDFDFNKVKDLKTEIGNDKIFRQIFDGISFYENRYEKDFTNKEKYNVYDNNMNLLYEDVIDSNFYTFDKYYVITKKDKTYLYDKEGKLYKTYNEPLRIYHYYTEKYAIAQNLGNNRYSVFDDNMDIMLSNYKKLSDTKDDYCTFQKGFKYGLTDYDGNELISFSIFDTMSEDGYEEKKYLD